MLRIGDWDGQGGGHSVPAVGGELQQGRRDNWKGQPEARTACFCSSINLNVRMNKSGKYGKLFCVGLASSSRDRKSVV